VRGTSPSEVIEVVPTSGRRKEEDGGRVGGWADGVTGGTRRGGERVGTPLGREEKGWLNAVGGF